MSEAASPQSLLSDGWIVEPDGGGARAAQGAKSRRRPGLACAEALVWLYFVAVLLFGLLSMLVVLAGWARLDEPTLPIKETLAVLGMVAGFLLPWGMLRFFPGTGAASSRSWPVLAYLPLVFGGLLALWIGDDDFHRRRLVFGVVLGSCSIFTVLLTWGVLRQHSGRTSRRRLFWLLASVAMISCASVILYGSSLRPRNALPWQETAVDGVIFCHAPGQPLDPQLLREFPKTLHGVEGLWHHHVARPQHLRIFLFPDDESLNAVAGVLGVGDIAGLFDAGGTDAILASAGPWADTGATLAHEYCHALNHLRYNGLPSFLDEGMARFTEWSLAAQLGQPAGDPEAIPEGGLADLVGEATFYEADPQYVFAGGLVAILVKRHGIEAFHRFCERVTAFSAPARELTAVEDAFRATYGGSFEVFVEQWRHGSPSASQATKSLRVTSGKRRSAP